MYQYSRQTTKRTKGSFAWQDTSYLRKVKKARKQKLRQYKVEKPLIKENKVKDQFGVTITQSDLDWMEIKLQQNRILKGTLRWRRGTSPGERKIFVEAGEYLRYRGSLDMVTSLICYHHSMDSA